MYRLLLTEEFEKELRKITNRDRLAIEKKILEYLAPQIKQEPHNGPNVKKLKNYNPETWRYRIGRYRLFYTIDENELLVSFVSIDQRKDAY